MDDKTPVSPPSINADEGNKAANMEDSKKIDKPRIRSSVAGNNPGQLRRDTNGKRIKKGSKSHRISFADHSK
jgi:hypothetical protein